MTSEDRTRIFFLGGIVALAVLIIGGLIWAVASGPDPIHFAEKNLHFTDDNDPARGPGEASVTVRIFGDLQCPACRIAEPGVKYAMEKYGNQVRFVWNDFPLVQAHLNAMLAANAARCAEAQDKFWQFHDQLYEHQDVWATLVDPSSVFIDYAKDLGLTTERFAGCLSAREQQRKIDADQAEGRANNVQATPTFFIGNIRYEGGLTSAQWDQAIQSQLANS